MGIKNLAFCEAEVSYPAKDSLNATMEVLRWEKVDLAPATQHVALQGPGPSPLNQDNFDADEGADLYSVGVLSKTAYGLVKKTILAGAPDVVLIEKQRWRSGNGSAVQQWTLRVNTLEGMLWAVLETLHTEQLLMLQKEGGVNEEKRLYEVHGIDPKRVGHYWLEQNAQRLASEDNVTDVVDVEQDTSATAKLSRSKAEKKAKIALLRSWFVASPASTASTTCATTPTISFAIGKNAEPTRRALCSPPKSTRARKSSSTAPNSVESLADDVPVAELRKLDDITDCFLQAAAWVSWESNRRKLWDIWRKRLEQRHGSESDDESLARELDGEVLLDMAREVEA